MGLPKFFQRIDVFLGSIVFEVFCDLHQCQITKRFDDVAVGPS